VHLIAQAVALIFLVLDRANLALAVGFLLVNVRNRAFLKVTAAYCVVMTALLVAIQVASSASLAWESSLLRIGSVYLPLPVAIAASSTGTAAVGWLVLGTASHLTIPLAIWRGAKLHVSGEGARLGPAEGIFRLISSVTTTLQSGFKAATLWIYTVGLGLIALVVLGYAVVTQSPKHPWDWPILLLGVYLLVLLSGGDLARNGVGIARPLHRLVVSSIATITWPVAIVAGLGTLTVSGVVISGALQSWFATWIPGEWPFVLALVITTPIAFLLAGLVFALAIYGVATLLRIPLIAILRLIEIEVPESYEITRLLGAYGKLLPPPLRAWEWFSGRPSASR
jgi:hypothetical protein